MKNIFDKNSLINYIKNFSFFDKNDILDVKEIGDGNLNYIFRISNSSNFSIIVKQSNLYGRTNSKNKISTKRTEIEYNILNFLYDISPNYSPKVYFYDKEYNCFIMEDLKDYIILRKHLLYENKQISFGKHLATFIFNLFNKTSDFYYLDHREKKKNIQKFINPDLCEISERLVFDEVITNYYNRNICLKENEDYVLKNIYNNSIFKSEATKLKFIFMNKTESLIHGDLHSGSIFIKDNSVKIFDPEFAFFGPIGYDLGNVVAHLLISKIYTEKYNYLNNEISIFLNTFYKLFNNSIEIKDLSTKNNKLFLKFYIENILEETAGFTGMEIIRRIIGVAKTEEILIKDPKKEKILLETGIFLVINKHYFKDLNYFISFIQNKNL